MQAKAPYSEPLRTSRLVQLFVERAGLKTVLTPEQVMSALISRFKRKSQRANTPEQRMQFSLRNRNILSVETVRDLQCHGLLEPIGSSFSAGFRILLRKQPNAERLRFTIAHEICHTFFYELVPELKFVPHEIDPKEERLCDVGAAELLMPAASVHRSAKSMAICLESLQLLAEEYSVSLSAMFLRLRTLPLWQCEFSEWHRMVNGTFVLENLYGGKPLAWEWEETSILTSAWQSNKSAFGHTFIRHADDRGTRFFRPTRYEIRRYGDRLLALWGAGIARPVRAYPLLDASSDNTWPNMSPARITMPLRS